MVRGGGGSASASGPRRTRRTKTVGSVVVLSLFFLAFVLAFTLFANGGRPVGSMRLTNTALLARTSSSSSTTSKPALTALPKNPDARRHKAWSLRNYSDTNNQVLHDGFFGLGHRLSRMASAYHFAYVLGAAQIRCRWNQECENSSTPLQLFELLFGPEPIMVHYATTNAHQQESLPSSPQQQLVLPKQYNKTLHIRNDVKGYTDADTLQRAHTNWSSALFSTNSTASIWWSKVESDVIFSQQLMDRFQQRDDRIEAFWKEHRLDQRTVIGVHLRLGNGEKDTFASSGRAVQNETQLVASIGALLDKMVDEQQREKAFGSNPPIVFLATDSEHLIDLFSNSISIPVITMAQNRPSKGKGVSYMTSNTDAADTIVASWRDMVVDMFLLARCRILVAPLYSSFTQSLPLSLVLSREGGTFCQASKDAHCLTCFDSMEAWLFRFKTSDMTSYAATTKADSNATTSQCPHVYQLMHGVQLPNPHYSEGRTKKLNIWMRNHAFPSQTRRYGTMIDPFYRQRILREEHGWYLDDGRVSQ